MHNLKKISICVHKRLEIYEISQNVKVVLIDVSLNCVYVKGKGKGKILPTTGHEGPEGEQMYSSTLPSTSALDGSGWSAPRPVRFTSGKDPVPFV